MPNTLQALLIAVFLISPGYVGDRVYREFVGENRKPWGEQVIHLVVFSLVSGALYTLAAAVSLRVGSLPDMLPLEYADVGRLGAEDRGMPVVPTRWFGLLGGHATVAGLLGATLGWSGSRWNITGLGYRYQTAWDHGISVLAPNRFVLVERLSGAKVFGTLRIVNRLREPPDRDIFIEDPRAFHPDGSLGDVDALAYLYLPASEVKSIAFIENDADEKRRQSNERRDDK